MVQDMQNDTSKKLENSGNKGTGIDPNLASGLCYLCGWVTGLIFILLEKDNKQVLFHAWQSVFLSLACLAYFMATFILSFITFVGILFGLLNIFVSLGLLALIIVLMVKAFQGGRLDLPVISDLATKQVEK